MAQLTVRNVDDAIAAALKQRAAESGRSAEAEHRRILEDALAPARRSDFFAAVPDRRVRLRDIDTTEILHVDRRRSGA